MRQLKRKSTDGSLGRGSVLGRVIAGFSGASLAGGFDGSGERVGGGGDGFGGGFFFSAL